MGHRRAVAAWVLGTLGLAACGGGGGGGGAPSDANWYYHFICNDDSECLSTNFAGAPEGTSNQGPGQGGEANCNSLLQFGTNFWNIPPAVQWCDHIATIPPAITVSGFAPASGAPGSTVTLTGTGFPSSSSGVTVTFGAVPAAIVSISSTQLVVTVPAVGNSSYTIAVATERRSATAPGTYTVAIPNPLGSTPVRKIAPGVNHVCAILGDDTVKCYGSNAAGQLGNGSTASTSNAVTVTGVANAIDVASGNSFSCAVVGAAPGQASGSVVCWGLGTSGQLGNNSNSSSSTAVAAGSMTTAIEVSARADHACALLSAGQVMCWGRGTEGQLGNNQTASSPVPVAVSGLGPDNYDVVDGQGEAASTKAFQVSAGGAHTCARVSTSSNSAGLGVKCWGATNRGELGNGAPFCQTGTICDPKNPTPVPKRVSNLTTAAHLAVGGHHSCVVLTTGGARCWGQGDQGQLGNANEVHSNVPVTVSGIAGATHASAGDEFSCASVSGALKCWGANGAGQLGDGGTTRTSTPVAATAIAADAYAPETLKGGDLETCLKRTDETAFCFP